jgi:internalin A
MEALTNQDTVNVKARMEEDGKKILLSELVLANKTTPQLSIELHNGNADHHELPDELFELVHLQKLKLFGFNLKKLSKKILKLTHLQELDMRGTSLEAFPTELMELPLLTNLLIGSSELTSLPAKLNRWQTLTYLHVAECNQLSKLLGIPPNLTYLHIGGTALNKIPSIVFTLNLHKIVLNDLKLTKLPEELFNMHSLGHLFIGDNELTHLPKNISNLYNLRTIAAYGNHLTALPESIGELQYLKSLDLSRNSLSDLPNTLSNLKRLEELEFGNNVFTQIPKVVFDIISLETLVIGNSPHRNPANINTINYIPQDLLKLKKLAVLSCYTLKIENIPAEILNKEVDAIQSYFLQLQNQEQDYLFEAKLLILGEPGAGKTSLARKLNNADCELPAQEDTTRGIDVEAYYFPINPTDFPDASQHVPDRKFRLNIWDFGGQEIYKATHRFFLSNRAVYLLVADSRNEDTDFKYWLHIVEIFGGNSPLLIIINEKHGRSRVVDTAGLKGSFGNIIDTLKVDLQASDKQRLHHIKAFVELLATGLSHIGSVVPAKWTIIREAIVADARSMMTVQEYLALCKENGIPKQADALVLSQYFHDIGVFLHFQEDAVLKHRIFLKPTWATNAVYKVLDHELLTQQHGRFSKADAVTIWHEEEFSFVRDELLRLMQNFFLTYEISPTEGYIVPEKLAPDTPDYEWDITDNLFFVYKYDFFMPKGLITQFIVKMHRYIFDHNLVWRRGVLLHRQDTYAEIIETYESSIRVRIAGKYKRDFMTVITEEINLINKQYSTLKIERLIPCNCSVCQNQKPYFYNFDNLRTRRERGKLTIECENSYKEVSVRSLLEEVVNEQLLSKNSVSEIAAMHKTQNSETRDLVPNKKIFISYAHTDDAYLKRLLIHFKTLEHEGIEVDVWSDKRLKSGTKWKTSIEHAMQECGVAILLVSQDFLASDFIMKVEIPVLLRAAEERGADIIPVIVSPCRYTQNKYLKDFQAQNDPKTPLSKLNVSQREEEYLRILVRVEEILSLHNT